MRAHQIDSSGLILNTIVVNSLDDLPNLVDASIGGGRGDSVIGGVLVPAAVVQPVPSSVTARQAVQALILAGIEEDAVEAAIAAIPDAMQRKLAANFWRRSNEFERSNPVLNSLAGSLGLDSDDLDDLFRQAATL